jgi:hypothetical protein
MKSLYKGSFQTQRRVFIERCMASSEKQAFFLICKRIAKKQGIQDSIIFDWFKDKDKYKLELEVEFKEVA